MAKQDEVDDLIDHIAASYERGQGSNDDVLELKRLIDDQRVKLLGAIVASSELKLHTLLHAQNQGAIKMLKIVKKWLNTEPIEKEIWLMWESKNNTKV